MDDMVKLDDFSKQVARADGFTIVNFWAGGNRDCKSMRRHLQAVAHEREEPISVLVIDWESEPDLAEQYNVFGVPCTLVFYEGRFLCRRYGVFDIDDFLEEVTTNVSSGGDKPDSRQAN